MGDKANIDFTTSLPNNGNRNTEGGLTDPHSLASYFGRLSYNFAERYMLQLTVRRDGSSRFGENNKWGYFPFRFFRMELNERIVYGKTPGLADQYENTPFLG